MTDKNANTEIRKEFCPNCEKDTECIHAAELYECQECGEDFAKYIVSRNCNVSDVSMTQDVTTPELPEDALHARIAELEEENDRLQDGWFRDETICPDGSLRPKVSDLLNRIAELEAENERLSQLLHDEMSQLEIATDLGNKRWTALNKIYEDGEKHNANWCKRMAQEGLGIK